MTDRSPAGRPPGGEGQPALTAAAIAAAVKGTLRGDPDVVITGVAPLERAGREHVTFLASAKYAPLFAECGAGVALVSPQLAELPGRTPARIVVDKPHEAMLSILASLYPEPDQVPGVHPTAVIGRGAQLGEGVPIAKE